MGTLTALTTALVVVMGGCKSRDQATPGPTAAETPAQAPSAQQLDGLLRGFDAVASVSSSERVRIVAPLMQETLAPDDACFADIGKVSPEQAFDLQRLVACARPCVVNAAELVDGAPDTRMRAVRTQCKDTDLGIAPEHQDLLTPELLLVARAARLIQNAHARAPTDAKSKLADAMERVSIPLPMPAWTQDYRLPVAPADMSAMVAAECYVTLRHLPVFQTQVEHIVRPFAVARFTPSGLRIEHPAGEPVEDEKAPSAGAGDPNEARQRMLQQARKNGVLGLLGSAQGSGASLEHRAGDEFEAVMPGPGDDSPGGLGPPCPRTMILADGQVEAARVVALAERLKDPVLGVTAQSPIAWGLAYNTPLRTTTAELRWDGRSAQIIVAFNDADTWVTSMPAGTNRQISRVGQLIDFEAVKDVVRELSQSPHITEPGLFSVHVSGKVPYHELVDVIAALSEAAPGTLLTLRALPPGPELTKDIIRRSIRRSLPRIRHCYERALLDQSDLSGTVTVAFSITPEGKTDDIEASGLHPDVDSCIARAFETLQFPKPKGGGSVQVTYPFIFQPDGSR